MSLITDFKFDPNDESYIRDPYPIYRLLRDTDPVHRMQNGCWVMTQYEDIDRALKNPVFTNSPHPFSIVGPNNRERFHAARVACNMMAFMDSPEHGEIKKPFNALFHKRMRDLQSMVSEITEVRFAGLPRGEVVDFLKEFANPMSVEVICRFIGLPLDRVDCLTRWSRYMFYLFHAIPSREVLEEVNQSLLEFELYIKEQLQRKRAAPENDLLSMLAVEDVLDDDEIIHNIMLIVADGIGNVDVGLALSVCTLLGFPEEYERLRENPNLARQAVAECLRYDSPAQYQGRILANATEIGGKELPAKSIVLLALASGNRDDRVAQDADTFRIDRQGFRHLSLGRGVHACLGAALVTLQFESVFEHLGASRERLVRSEASIEWYARAGHRWPKALPVILKWSVTLTPLLQWE